MIIFLARKKIFFKKNLHDYANLTIKQFLNFTNHCDNSDKYSSQIVCNYYNTFDTPANFRTCLKMPVQNCKLIKNLYLTSRFYLYPLFRKNIKILMYLTQLINFYLK